MLPWKFSFNQRILIWYVLNSVLKFKSMLIIIGGEANQVFSRPPESFRK